MSAIDPATSIGDIVARRPSAATTLEGLGIDYCCGGHRTLADACQQRGLDAATVAAVLEATTAGAAEGAHDVAGAPIGDLCDHIVAAHHEPLRRELPRIAALLDTVVRVHSGEHPELHDLRRRFASMREELEEHLDLEERELFPTCRALAAGGDAPIDGVLLATLDGAHTETGDALAALRELAGDYRPESAFCGTHRALLRAMHEMETDLHRHVHEENNILFPRVLAITAGA